VLIRLRRELADGKLKTAGDNQAQTELMLEDGSHYAEPGKLQFAETTVDPGTGSVTLRAVYPNPQRILLPGMFVHQQIQEGIDDSGLLIPQRAVTHNQQGEATTIVVGGDNVASVRVIKTDRAIGDSWLVSSGVSAGDKVVVVGLQRLQGGGGPVKPHEVAPDATDAPAESAAPQKQ
jgi:membrane fusion protein (multidrug efflux system)